MVIAALVDKELLRSSGSEQGQTLRLAHPALALTWRTLRRYVAEGQRDRLLIAGAAAEARRWARRGRPVG